MAYLNTKDVYDLFENGVAHLHVTDIDSLPRANVLELNTNYQVGDICIYGGGKSQSYALVQIEQILDDERGIARLKFIIVFNDNTGNNYFTYLLKTGKMMNGSFKYLKNITPRVEEENDE